MATFIPSSPLPGDLWPPGAVAPGDAQYVWNGYAWDRYVNPTLIFGTTITPMPGTPTVELGFLTVPEPFNFGAAAGFTLLTKI